VSDDELPFPLFFARPVEVRHRDFDLTGALARLRQTPPTGRRDQVVIFTTRADDHADAVMLELMSRGVPVRRVNVDGIPDATGLTVEFTGAPQPRAVLKSPSGEILLDEIRTVWMRRPIINLLPSGAPQDASAAVARSETETALRGLISLLAHALWVNPMASLWAAESKVRQLRVAASEGLTIPHTLVTNDPDRALAFYHACAGRVIVKAFRGQVGPPTDFQMIYTSRVLPEHVAQFARIRNAPCIFQEEAAKEAELRITIIGRRIFPVEIRSHSGSLDWRDESAPISYRPTTLPPAVEMACWKLIDHWQLRSAAIDMIRRPDGEHVFLEINAHNDWLWLERITGLPLVDAMADLLDSGSVP
jgi:glutathione synthase/RimK-type ligase-like ATP-grasp enzyme